MKIKWKITLSIFATLFLIGCGGGWGETTVQNPPEPTLTANLIDSAVAWASYDDGCGHTDKTTSDGTFHYKEGCNITFTVGGVNLGTILSSEIQSDTMVTIQDLVWTDRSNTSDEKVVKIAQFLQSLDDNTSDDTITIGDAIHTHLKDTNFSFDGNVTTQSLNTVLNIAWKTAITEAAAISHLDTIASRYWITPNKKPQFSWEVATSITEQTPYFAQLNISDEDGTISKIETINLPSWITFDNTTHQLSGTPTQAWEYTFSIKVTDDKWLSTTKVYTVNGIPQTPAEITWVFRWVISSGDKNATLKLEISDQNIWESKFVAQTDANSTYWFYSISEDGTLSFHPNYNNLDIRKLTSWQSLTDTFSVSSVDWTTKQISVEMNWDITPVKIRKWEDNLIYDNWDWTYRLSFKTRYWDYIHSINWDTSFDWWEYIDITP